MPSWKIFEYLKYLDSLYIFLQTNVFDESPYLILPFPKLQEKTVAKILIYLIHVFYD